MLSYLQVLFTIMFNCYDDIARLYSKYNNLSVCIKTIWNILSMNPQDFPVNWQIFGDIHGAKTPKRTRNDIFCCVFWPVNMCFASCILVEMNFCVFSHLFPSKKKTVKKHIRGLQAFRCYSKPLVNTQKLVDSRRKIPLQIIFKLMQ